jgi:hypothetical protein
MGYADNRPDVLRARSRWQMMVDPIIGAALLAASLFARKALEETGSATGQALSTGAGRLLAWLRHAGRGNAEIASALTLVEAAPEDAARIDLLGTVIADHVRGNDFLGQELLMLVKECQADSGVVTLGGAHIHGNISGGTISQYGGNHIELHNDRSA